MKFATCHVGEGTISLIHQNVRSIGNSVDLLEDVLRSNQECGFLCISEHWKTEQQLKVIGFENFSLGAYFCRERDEHGGVAVYVRENIQFGIRKNICALSVKNHFECAAIESNVNGEKILIAVIYRTPTGDINIFLEKLEKLLSDIFGENGSVFIAGDFNINLNESNSKGTDFLSLLQSFSLSRTISDYTRVTDTSKSCLDNIFTNHRHFQTKIIDTHISDHNAQKIVFKVGQTKNENKIKNFKIKRLFKEDEKLNFLDTLKQLTWEDVYSVERFDVNKQWDVFMGGFINVFHSCFPLKRVCTKTKIKHYTQSETIKECKKRLDTLLILKNQNSKYKDQYNQTKREYDRLLIKERSKLYENKIKKSDNKMKCLWHICNEITAKKRYNRDCQMEGTPEKIAENYNNYLLNIIQ